MPRAARRRPGVRNGYCIYYISAVAVRGASPCRTSTKSGTPGRTTRADDNNGDTVAAGSANNDGIRAGWSSCGPAPCPGASGLPQTRPCPHPAVRRRIGTKAAGTLPRDAARVLRRQHDGHVAQKVAGHPAGRPATACKTALRPAVRQKIFGRHRRGFRNLELGPATQEPDRGCCIPVAGPAATGSGLPGSSAPGAAAVVCPGMAAGRGAPAQALNGGSGARPDGHRPHGPRPEDVLTAGRFPRQRGLAADRAEAVFTSP